MLASRHFSDSMWRDMIAKVYTSIPFGYDGRIIEVECAITQGLPQFDIVGMANKTVSEARQRVRSAIKSSGLKWPDSHIIVNLAPAELVKNGNFFDIPIAISILIASNQLRESDVKNTILSGELTLDGNIKPVRGIINIIEAGKDSGFSKFYIPKDNINSTNFIKQVSIFGAANLQDLIMYLKNQKEPELSTQNVVKNNKTDEKGPFLAEIYGQELAKKALIVALAGHHNILLSGPPGAGKTMLAHAAINLMPPLTEQEILEITKIHSLASATSRIKTTRPFRSPHHTSTIISLIGGGNQCIPGDISLSHLGVLFLDELPEYPRAILESLRQPLEDKQISISRAGIHCTYPANFMLIATMNPCPCGFLGDKTHECKCKNFEIQRYKNKISGPLLDRIDIRISVERTNQSNYCKQFLNAEEILKTQNVVKNNITEAIQRQHTRYHSQTTFNADLSSSQIVKYIKLTDDAKAFLDNAAEKLTLSARSYFKIIKVARTIADLANEPVVNAHHITEALSYRMEL